MKRAWFLIAALLSPELALALPPRTWGLRLADSTLAEHPHACSIRKSDGEYRWDYLNSLARRDSSQIAQPDAALLSGEEILLWPGDAPGSEGLPLQEILTERSRDPNRHDRIFTRVLRPSLRAHRPAVANGAAVIVAPGGGYQEATEGWFSRSRRLWLGQQRIEARSEDGKELDGWVEADGQAPKARVLPDGRIVRSGKGRAGRA